MPTDNDFFSARMLRYIIFWALSCLVYVLSQAVILNSSLFSHEWTCGECV